MEKEENIDLSIFLAEAFSTNDKAYKHIDKIYNKDKYRYLEASKNSEYYNSTMFCQGNIIQDYYFKKSLGIILESDTEDILNICKLSFRQSYNYIVSVDKLIMTYFVKKIMTRDKAITDDKLNGSILVAIVLANNMNKNIDTTDEFYNVFMKSLFIRSKRMNEKYPLAYENLSKEGKNKLRKIELKLNSKYLRDYIPCIPTKFDDNNLISLKNLSDVEKQLLGYEYIYDLENISLLSLIDRNVLNSKDMQELIGCWLHLQSEQEDIDKLDYEKLYKFIYPAMSIRYLVRAYKESKDFFFKNFDEDLKEILENKELELSEIKKKNLLLQDENEKLKAELEMLKNKNNNLEKDISKFSSKENELIQLRNFMFVLNEENQEDSISANIDIDKLNNLNAVVVGGTNAWIKSMKEVLDNYVFIPASAENFDVNLLKNKEYVFINTKYNSHAMYYKVIENMDTFSKLRYINTSNKDRVLQEINNNL